MAETVSGLSLWIHYQLDASPPYLLIDYTPLRAVAQASAVARKLKDYNKQFQIEKDALPAQLQRKLTRLGQYVVATLDVPELDLGGFTARGLLEPVYYQVSPEHFPGAIDFTYRLSGSLTTT
jgi:hypothetical protein